MKINDEIRIVPIEQLMPHSLNSYYHSPLREEERMALYESIKELGITEPLWVTRSHLIVSGHERLNIAKELQSDTVPVRFVEDATADEILYLLISSNAARRGSERDFIKKARQAKVLYEHWGIRAGRPAKSGHGDHITRHDVAGAFGASDRTIRRLIKLLELIPELQLLVSQEVIGLRAGNDLAELSVEEQQEIYRWLSRSNLKEVRVEEVRAIRKEIEYMRHRDRITRTLGLAEQPMADAGADRHLNLDPAIDTIPTAVKSAASAITKTTTANISSEDLYEGSTFAKNFTQTVPMKTNKTVVETNPDIEVASTEALSDSPIPPKVKTLEAIHSLVPDANAENIKRRVLSIQLERVMRQIDRWDDELFRLLEQEEADTEIDNQMVNLANRLNETSKRILNLRKK